MWTADRFTRGPCASATVLSLLLTVVAAGCTSTEPAGLEPGTAPPGSSFPTSALTFVPLGRNSPGLSATTATFWAKVGENRELRLYYRPRPGRADSTEFLRFRVKNRSLLRRPDGSPFAANDSVLITVRISDPVSLVVEFLPAGLLFDPNEAAELKLSFKERGGDLNDDGRSDGADAVVRTQIAVWRQESVNLPWVKLASTLLVGADEIEARLTGFTSYAIAY